MENCSPLENSKKTALEDLSKEELVKKCKTLLVLAQKAKQAKDSLQEENNELKSKLQSVPNKNETATSEIIENLTQQKLQYVTTIEDLKLQLNALNNKLQNYEERINTLDNENVSYKRQTTRLTDENEQLITHLERLEKQFEECKKLGLEQQTQLLALEEGNKALEQANIKLQQENTTELQKMLSISLEEVKKLKSENESLEAKMEIIKVNLSEKDEKILTINEELHTKTSQIETIQSTTTRLKEKLKLYHSKIIKFAENIKVIKQNKNEILLLFRNYTEQVEKWKIELNKASQNILQQIGTLQKENDELKESNAKFLELLEAHKTDDEKSKELNDIENVRADNRRLLDENSALLALQEKNKGQIEALIVEKAGIVEKHQDEIRNFGDQCKKDTREIQDRIEENERICIEYRKIITKLEEDINVHVRECEKLKQKNYTLQEEVEHLKTNEKQFADTTSEEILKLVQENANLLDINKKLLEKPDSRDIFTQTNSEEGTASLKRKNSEMLKEMNEMNQALKERGETISKLQAHCEEVMKKLQLYETQANKNVDNLTQKEELIINLQKKVETLKTNENDDLIIELRNEIEILKEKLNANFDSSYAESETMSTSTISKTEEGNRLKDLEGSWEERYGKLRNLAIKLKGKVRELSAQLTKEQNEKNEIQQKCALSSKTITTLQAQCDKLEDELEMSKQQCKEYAKNLDSVNNEMVEDKHKLVENEEIITKLKKEIEELNYEKANTEMWKKQIGNKVQAFRKELELNKSQRKECEVKISKLTAELEAKEQALKAESDCHKQTKNSLEHSNNERKKHSVLNLEMQDYERSVKELSQKLEKKQEEINKLKSQLDSQKSTANALREQNKLLEEKSEEMTAELAIVQGEVVTQKKQINELEEVIVQKSNKIEHFTQLLETVRGENEELSTELSKVIAEHQKLNSSLRNEKEHLRSQILGLQQSLRETQDTLTLKEEELAVMRSDYDSYKVRAQSVLRQNQNRDVGLEEKLTEELSTVKGKCEGLQAEIEEYKIEQDKVKKANQELLAEKMEIIEKCTEISREMEDLRALYDQLTSKHEQTIIEHSETVRSLKVHAETLAQCYRQQLSEQEMRHNREVVELQSRIEKAPSPTDLPLPPLPLREEGEGSESTENNGKTNVHPVPLERLLGTDSEQEIAFMKKQLSEEQSKVMHLTALLADTEQDLAKHVQMNKLLKEEIRRQQRSVEREKHAENLEYLKNVVFKFVTLHSGDERSRLVPVLNTILKLSPEETQKLNMVAKGDPGIRGWTNYLPLWSPSK